MTVQTDFLERCKALNLHDGKLSDWLDEIESLRQQLASASDEIERLKGDKYVQLGTNSNPAKPEQQRELAGTLEMGQLLGGGSHETAGNSKAERKVTLIDDFRGDLNRLVASATALVELDIAGALVPHGIGGHARRLLSALCIRIQALRQQLAAALAVCKQKDEALEGLIDTMDLRLDDDDLSLETRTAFEALAIQPDDTALKAWLGEPVGEVGSMPGTSGFTMATFVAATVPVGTMLYANQKGLP